MISEPPTHLLANGHDRKSLCGITDPLPRVWIFWAGVHVRGHGAIVCPDCVLAAGGDVLLTRPLLPTPTRTGSAVGTMDTYERPTQYVVSAVAEDLCADSYAWNVEVDWRGPGDLWAVKHFSQCLGADGKWDYEPIPSSRTDAWKAKHRFPLAEALRLAHAVAPGITVNGTTPADLLTKYEAVK